jgi:hypothetical protein
MVNAGALDRQAMSLNWPSAAIAAAPHFVS